mmetsp:Transcript_109744/g.342062  ORF Transcript_109744/g.342062 Transcript_109744/m.342062 type:complete len:200 (+) Transcript_109744:286-885(+)
MAARKRFCFSSSSARFATIMAETPPSSMASESLATALAASPSSRASCACCLSSPCLSMSASLSSLAITSSEGSPGTGSSSPAKRPSSSESTTGASLGFGGTEIFTRSSPPFPRPSMSCSLTTSSKASPPSLSSAWCFGCAMTIRAMRCLNMFTVAWGSICRVRLSPSFHLLFFDWSMASLSRAAILTLSIHCVSDMAAA